MTHPVSEHSLGWHVVDFRDDFVLACDLTFEQACLVQDENYGGLMIIQDNSLSPKMLIEVQEHRAKIT
jgi:hypothetical protein